MSLPLHLCQVLEDEYVALYGELPETATWRVEPHHVTNPERLAATLRADDALAAYLRSHGLDAALLPRAGEPLRTGLAQGLNAAITSGALYDTTRFAHVALPAELTRLVGLDAEGDDLVHVNRLLLEAAFPDDITPIHEARTAAIHGAIHRRATRDRDPAPRTALCFSGGGIRSATFGLGVVQALAHLRLLDKFDYLSTVSGGGYLGSWLSAWTHRHRQGVGGVMGDVTAPAPKPPLRPEPTPIRHLREYSNYLSPKLGALSADTWTLVATYFRNLFLNWLVLVPILLAALAVPRLGASVLQAPPAVGAQLVILLAGFACLVASVVYMGISRPSAQEQRSRRPWSHLTGQPSFLVACLTPLVLSAMLLTAWWMWSGRPTSLGYFSATGGSLHLIAWVLFAAWMKRARVDEAGVAVCTGLVAGLLVWVAADRVKSSVQPDDLPRFLVTFAVPLFLTAFLLATTLFVGLVSRFTNDDDREWLARFGGWVLIVVVAWALLGTLVIYGPELLAELGTWGKTMVGAAGVLSAIGSALLGRSPATSARNGEAGGGGGVTAVLMKHATTIVALVTLIALVIGLSVLTNPIMRWLSETIRSIDALRSTVRPMPWGLWQHRTIVAESTVTVSVVFMVLTLAIGLGMSMFVNVNKFSLHAMYRNRLIRAYLGASRERRRPNPFTGFDPGDNIRMYELRRGLLHMDGLDDVPAFVETLTRVADPRTQALFAQLRPGTQRSIREHAPHRALSPTLQDDLVMDLNRLLLDNWFAGEPAFTAAASPETTAALAAVPRGDALIRANRMLLHEAYPTTIAPPPPVPHGLLHIVNVALNLVSGHNLAWQERKAETFTVSPLHAGSYHLGYRPARAYGGPVEGISLGTAITISGAAASPNMGYHSSPLLALVMMFFNVRLGWWLGNPGVYGQRTYAQAFPQPSIKPMLAEAFGLTDDTSQYVYLSDGGHFDNLGLLEMIVRRCHFIVLSDAGADGTCSFEDLANAMRKVRIDLGVPIVIRDRMRIVSRTHDRAGLVARYCALADVDYKAVDGPEAKNGTILYIKPSFYGDEPTDIFNYATAHPEFPHESTADQFFSESQFESYRMLGFYAMQSIWQATWGPVSPYAVTELQTRAEAYLKPEPPAITPDP